MTGLGTFGEGGHSAGMLGEGDFCLRLDGLKAPFRPDCERSLLYTFTVRPNELSQHPPPAVLSTCPYFLHLHCICMNPAAH